MSDLYEHLEQLYKSDEYPFHMPGHKREAFIDAIGEAYHVDITEIEGYDNLYEAEGYIKEALDYAKNVYHSDETMFLVNGSTVGLLAAITAAVPFSGTILVARNCHKAVFHAAELRHLRLKYLTPEWNKDWDVLTSITVDEVRNQLKKNPEVKAVLITSPTYEGHVSDIEKIAEIVHEYGIPLIVDEAHGAHFIFDERFPKSATQSAADIVIQSMHKTLPSFTQTALIHVKKGYINPKDVMDYVGFYQTSSPSYLFMGTMDRCIRQLHEAKESTWNRMFIQREKLLKAAETFKHIRIKKDTEGCKLLISVKNTNITGRELQLILLKEFHLQMEMAANSFVVAIITAWDSEEGFKRLYEALRKIDNRLETKQDEDYPTIFPIAETVYALYELREMEEEWVDLLDARGRIGKQFVNLYPPGIPIIIPGEQIEEGTVKVIQMYREKNFPIQGVTKDGKIAVCKRN